uniref:Uncharacterized protein n=1 Tax=Anguilla anguilla TaxID=7936 RepID=A0A0E9VL01_ANGAN
MNAVQVSLNHFTGCEINITGRFLQTFYQHVNVVFTLIRFT